MTLENTTGKVWGTGAEPGTPWVKRFEAEGIGG